MIDFQALKQQLKLLGHHLPDDQIRSILADMKVDVCELPGHSPALPSGTPSTSRPPRRCLASELDESCPPTPEAAATTSNGAGPIQGGSATAAAAAETSMAHSSSMLGSGARPTLAPRLAPAADAAEEAATVGWGGGSQGGPPAAHAPLAPPSGTPPPWAIKPRLDPTAHILQRQTSSTPAQGMIQPHSTQPHASASTSFPPSHDDEFLRACASPPSAASARTAGWSASGAALPSHAPWLAPMAVAALPLQPCSGTNNNSNIAQGSVGDAALAREALPAAPVRGVEDGKENWGRLHPVGVPVDAAYSSSKAEKQYGRYSTYAGSVRAPGPTLGAGTEAEPGLEEAEGEEQEEEEYEEEDEEVGDDGVEDILAQYYGARGTSGPGAGGGDAGAGGWVGGELADSQLSGLGGSKEGWTGGTQGRTRPAGASSMAASRAQHQHLHQQQRGLGAGTAARGSRGGCAATTNEVVHERRGSTPSLLRAVADGTAPVHRHHQLHHQAGMGGTPPPRAYGGSARPGQQQEGSATKARSPESVSGLSLGGRSSIARTSVGSIVGGPVRPGSAPKIDRVARYKQLQQGWSKDKFLSAATHGSRPSSAPQRAASTATRRKPVNFHAHFQMLHAAEAEEKKRVLAQARAQTASELSPGAKFVSPADKRRDGLRWEMRMRMAQY